MGGGMLRLQVPCVRADAESQRAPTALGSRPEALETPGGSAKTAGGSVRAARTLPLAAGGSVKMLRTLPLGAGGSVKTLRTLPPRAGDSVRIAARGGNVGPGRQPDRTRKPRLDPRGRTPRRRRAGLQRRPGQKASRRWDEPGELLAVQFFKYLCQRAGTLRIWIWPAALSLITGFSIDSAGVGWERSS